MRVLQNLKKRKSPLETRYRAILAGEQRLANAVVKAVILPPAISVWDMMIPLLFIFKLATFRNARDTFLKNILYTKTLALSAAADIAGGRDQKTVWLEVEARTNQVLASVDARIYSKEIREKQLAEINLLLTHYTRLFQANETDYGGLIATAYARRQAYENFLENLREAEKKTMAAARNTLGDQADHTIANKIETTTYRLRQQFSEKIFAMPLL